MKRLAVTLVAVLCAGSVRGGAAIRIERLPCSWPNGEFEIDLRWQNVSPGFEMGGFDLTFKHDSALTCQSVAMGDLLADCGWEYFIYDIPPSYRVQIIAIADIGGGPSHPSCYGDSSGVLATLVFRVADDQSLLGDFLSIWWYWYDCGDNAVSSRSGDTLFISDDVFHFDGEYEYKITRDEPFPSPYGAPSECVGGPGGPLRAIDFYNGGMIVSGPDIYPPTAHCPDPIIVPNDPGQCGAVVTYEAFVTDNCSDATVNCFPVSGTFFAVGTASVNCMATDVGGNAAYCQFFVTVVDTTRPVVTCPGDTNVANDSGQCGATVEYVATATDNCPGVTVALSPPSGSSFLVGSSPVRAIATDVSGKADTCEFYVTVNDVESPSLNCPDDITVANDSGECGAVVTYGVSATDNCHWIQLTSEPPSGSLFPVGTTLVAVIGADVSGIADTCWFNVFVQDTQPPVITCPADTVVANDSGQCGAVVTYQVIAGDNCPDVTVLTDPPSGSWFDIGVTEVIAIATDAAGGADTAVFTVTVSDEEPPSLSCPDSLAVSSEAGVCGASVAFDIVASDNCPGVTFAATPESGSFFEIGTTVVNVIAADQSGRSDSCWFPVVVDDTVPPLVVCPDDLELNNDSGLYGAVVDFEVTADDNCPGWTVAALPQSGSEFPVGVTLVEVIARDSSGNGDSCQFSVTVVLNDPDGDSLPSWDDNCPEVHNPEQADTDGDGVGDACCCQVRGDVDDTSGAGGPVDVADLTFLIAYLFQGGPSPSCPEQANVDAIITVGIGVDVGDLAFLASYLFLSGPTPDPC